MGLTSNLTHNKSLQTRVCKNCSYQYQCDCAQCVTKYGMEQFW